MPVYGIDFGYSEACIAAMGKDGRPFIIQNCTDGKDKLDCAVYFENENNVLVGAIAKDLIGLDDERIVIFPKRELGRFDSTCYEFDGRCYSPVEICALILKRLKQMCEEQGYCVNDVAITMPTYFGLAEKSALKNAAEIAGFKLVGTICEPTAAALAYLYNQEPANKNILVYDLGGRSFDVSVLKMSTTIDENGNIIPSLQVTAIGGNDMLGGKDWDDRLFNFILQACCDENGFTEDEIDNETRQLIRIKTEMTKKKLSYTNRAKVRIAVNGEMTSITVNREDFENLTSDLVAQTMNYVEETLQNAGNIDIDTVFLVGGSTYMPMIRNAVKAIFPGKVQIHEPDRAVAMGAAVYGQMIGENQFPPPRQRKVSPYSSNLIANMIRYSIDHAHDDVAKELISEVDWERLTPGELFDFFNRIRHLFKK